MSEITKVVVTGAAGGVGQAMCRGLAAEGFQVRGLVRPEDHVAGLPVEPDQLVRGYVEDPGAVAEALGGADAVINCAALLPRDLHLGREAFQRVNVQGPLNILRQAARLGLRRTVFFSTIGVVDHIGSKITPANLRDYVPGPYDAYLESKIDAEKALEVAAPSFPGEVSVLRPAYIYGPNNYAVWKDALLLLERGKMRLIGDGTAPFPLIAAEDIARFVAVLLKRPCRTGTSDIYTVASPEPTTMKEVFDYLADSLGVRRPRCVPSWALNLAADLVTLLPEKVRVGRLKLLTRERVLRYTQGYDLSGVIEPPPLGFVPRSDYRVGLALMLEGWRRVRRSAA